MNKRLKIVAVAVAIVLAVIVAYRGLRRAVVPGAETHVDATANIFVYEDVDGNGRYINEPPLANSLVVATANIHGTFFQYAALTDENGRATIRADYTHFFDIGVVAPCGYTATTPQMQSVAKGLFSPQNRFGFQPQTPQPGAETLHFQVWHDVNRDGRWQENEPPLRGIQVALSSDLMTQPDVFDNGLSATTEENGQAALDVGNTCDSLQATSFVDGETTQFSPNGQWDTDNEIDFAYDATTTTFEWGIATMRRFKFSSGGAYHPEGIGEWRVTLEADGTFEPTHQLGDVIHEYGPFTLSEAENQELWALIASADFASLPETFTRLGIPDETAYTFVVDGRHTATTVEIWTADAQQNPALLALTNQIFQLIEAYTGLAR